jgi:hypothetical protein
MWLLLIVSQHGFKVPLLKLEVRHCSRSYVYAGLRTSKHASILASRKLTCSLCHVVPSASAESIACSNCVLLMLDLASSAFISATSACRSRRGISGSRGGGGGSGGVGEGRRAAVAAFSGVVVDAAAAAAAAAVSFLVDADWCGG